MPFKNSYLAEVAKKLKKRRHKIIYSSELKPKIQKIMWPEYTDKRGYKIIYYLKNKWYILSIKKEIFYVKFPEDHISEDLIIDDWYRLILHHHCKSATDGQRHIWWLKALEFNLSNHSIPDQILIITPNKQSKEVIVSDKIVHFKKYTSKKTNHYKLFKKYTDKIKMWKHSFRFSNKELSLLESLYNFDELHDRYTYEIIRKVVKKMKDIDTECISQILKSWKHHSSVNRLYKICLKENKKLAALLLPSIKKWSFQLDI